MKFCFNPCFSGISSGSSSSGSGSSLISGFNPCFSGISSGRLLYPFSCRNGNLFQSLFFWNFVREIASTRSVINGCLCFNPCFSGISSGSPHCWKYSCHKLLSFNPCFSGISSGSPQSCLCFRHGKTVSILVFLEFRPGVDNLIIKGMHAKLFQSLFFWNFVREFRRSIIWLLTISVSILVFLEFRPGDIYGDQMIGINTGFNPCFSGISSGSRHRAGKPLRRICSFNPCFSGISSGSRTEHWISTLRNVFQSLFFWNFVREK